MALGGPLSVKLASGYVPNVGDQFQVVSSPHLTGVFGSTALPGGLAVNYSNGSVYLVVTGAVTQLPPAIISQPVNVTNVAGATVNFQVAFSGTPPFGLTWQFNGTNLSDSTRISGSQGTMLTIGPITTGDVGGYQVIVTNSIGSVTSRVATLSLLPVPSYSYLVLNTPNLVGYWPFTPALQANSAVGGITGVFMGNAAVGPAGSGPALPDQSGNTAVLVDGTADYVGTSLYGGLSTTGLYPDQGTIVGWFQMSTLPSITNRTFYIAGESLGGDDMDLQIEPDNKLKFYTDSGRFHGGRHSVYHQ